MKVEIWSDIVCPWCYIGKARFETALAGFAYRSEVEVKWRSFQLDPSAPPVSQQTVVEMLSRKYSLRPAEATRLEQQVADLAAKEGLVINADRFLANTRDAHRLLHLAADHGRQDILVKRLFVAHFAEKQVVSDHATLAQLAAASGIDPDEVRRVLESDAYVAEAGADAAKARALGANGVPFFVIDGRYIINGAQSTELFMQIMQQAQTEHPPVASVADPNTCGSDGCAV